MLVDEFAERLQLRVGQGVHSSERRRGAVFKVDFEVIQTMRSETVGLFLAEDIGEVVVIFRKSGKVNFLIILIIVDGGRTGGGLEDAERDIWYE